MFSGSRLYSFAPRKAKERSPVDNLHLGRFNCDMFLVLRPDTHEQINYKDKEVPDLSYTFEP